MDMRTMQKLDEKVSLLGFGGMRFPLNENGGIDEKAAEAMLDYAYSNGVNYFDTAYPYHSGKSEPFMGRILKKYPREKIRIATKLPCWEVKKPEDVERLFNEQLAHLQTDYVDFYLMHALEKNRWHDMLKLGVVESLEKLQREGKIRHLGFSFHDEYDVFEEIITYRKWDFCQIQLNYMDADQQAGLRGHDLAMKLGVPLVIMEPIKGGSLTLLPEESVSALLSIDSDASQAKWALRWVASLSNVYTILSGMSTLDQVKENVKICSDLVPLSEEELTAVDATRRFLEARIHNNCTGCRYCMPCPQGVDIPKNFFLWNEYGKYANRGSAAWHWQNEISAAEKPDHCIECGLCETKCPQHISIRENLRQAKMDMDATIENN
ncbi:MAG TPA: aldo/keto reductase [Bacillota bacterium]|nr:aldo/keto reductase [Bacillota bacterium]